jgi:2-keto-4-pentenoate hydratase/2-oxohepta-3-ene-1,7-dioic acid hydratase in catechol pathway
MKLTTLQADRGAIPVAVDDDDETPRYIDLTGVDAVLPNGVAAILAAEEGLVRAATAFHEGRSQGRYVEGRPLAPIPSPGKVLCIGLNYRDHAVETGAAIPTEPVVFSKFASAIVGPDDEIVLPEVATQVDYEAELVAVVGRRGRRIAAEDAFEYVAGYMCGNDVSARDWQKGRPGGQWLLGKTPDTFAPTGPYLVTADEIADPHELAIALRRNGETLQDGNTREFIFGIDRVIAHISQLVTLEPGDLIFTGTPPGVGVARKPPIFLVEGDVVEVEIAGLGILRNRVVAERTGGY